MKTWSWYVYIIECDDNFLYTGVTYNLEIRLEQHKFGRGSKFTSRHKFKKLLYFEKFNDINEARNRENQIKGWSRKKKLLFVNNKLY